VEDGMSEIRTLGRWSRSTRIFTGVLLSGALGCGAGSGDESGGEQTDDLALAAACIPDCQTADCSNELPKPGVLDGALPAAHEFTLELAAGTHTFETSALDRPQADPVLHLLDASGTEVAVADVGGVGNNAKLAATITAAGSYTLVLRSKTTTSFGKATIAQNGSVLASNVSFGGWQVRVSCLRKYEVLETVRPPNGAGKNQAIYLLKADGLGIERRSITGGTAGAVRLQPNTALGTRNVIVAARDDGSVGAVRLVRNDFAVANHDAGDHDGLGIELEQAIGTCSSHWASAQGFDCSKAADPRDTDGDAISDTWELLGRRDLEPHQPLPQWGANPRHKDLFMEVDFRQTCNTTDDLKMPADNARLLARVYADNLNPGTPAQQAGHAAALVNPDGLTGISLHLDTGVAVAASNPEDAALYGDWGGHNAVPPIQPSTCMARKITSAWETQMVPARKGIFHYAYGTDGLETASKYTAYSAFPVTDLGSIPSTVRALASSLGLNQSGNWLESEMNPYCNPTRPSLPNQAYFDHFWTNPVMFSDGLGRPSLNNSSLSEVGAVSPTSFRYLNELANVFHYNVNASNGNVDWNRDGVFSSTPVRAFANFAPGGTGCRWTNNNEVYVDLGGQRAPALSRFRGSLFLWNVRSEDGKLQRNQSSSLMNCPQSHAVNCGNGTFNAPIVYDFDATRGVDTVNVDYAGSKRLLLVRADAQGNLFSHQLQQGPGNANVLTSPEAIPSSGSEGEPALAATSGGEAFLAYRGPAGKVLFRRFLNGTWGTEVPVHVLNPDGSVTPVPPLKGTASPELAFVPLPSAGFGNARQLFGAFADEDGAVRLYRFDPSSFLWSPVDALEEPPTVTSKPSMVWLPSTTGADVPGRLYFYYIAADGQMRMQMTYAADMGAPQFLGLDSPIVDTGTLGRGLSAYYEPGVDSNVKLATTNIAGSVALWPTADGISDYTLDDNDDWATFAATLCNTTVKQSLITDPLTDISCPEMPWLP
jgi:hypothetical protein